MEPMPLSTRRRFALVALFLLAFVILLNGTTFVLYRRAQAHLDHELGARLRAAAAGAAHAMELGTTDSTGTGEYSPRLLRTLYSVRDENELSNVVVMSPAGITWIDLAGYADPGTTNPLVDIDYSAIALARSGVTSHTGLYRSGAVYMKSAYAPVFDDGGNVVALVGVEAGAAFFDELRGLRRLILVISTTSLGVAGILALVFFRQSRSLDRALAAAFHNENLAAMGRMAANIAHEVRNPLSIIRTSAARIRRRGRIDNEALDYIVEEVDALNEILTGYLDFATNPGSLQNDEASVNEVIQRSIAAATSEAHDRHVNIVEPGGDDLVITGDGRRIRQAVLNVILNAVQATEPGGSVEVTTAASPDGVEINVRDCGCGIAPSDLSEVTRPFFTRRAGGSGLGLNIVDTIVREHNGTLKIDSEPGSGTTVSLRFPRVVRDNREKE